MAALLNIIDLRRHALPADFLARLAPGTGHPDRLRPPHGGRDRPYLSARWHIGAEGRPVCSWSAVDGPEVRVSPG